MKKILSRVILPFLGLGCMIASCNDWTDLEPQIKENLLESNKIPEYYEQLRAYRKSDHPIAFGWFGNWSGKGASLVNCMAGLPDSVDVISMWGSWKNPTEAMLKDLRLVQQQRGTKALVCFIVQNIGDQLTPEEHKTDLASIQEYWGWKDGDNEAINQAIRKYANAICDTIDKYQYDGFDIDYEPNYGHSGSLGGKRDRMLVFIEALSKRIGPKSGTERLLVIDGEPQSAPKESGPMFNYFIVQAYASYGDSDLDRRLNSTIDNFAGVLTPEEVARKYVVTENFENYAQTGGTDYTDHNGKTMKSLEGMARWNPVINGRKVRKGGVGTYHMEYEFTVSGKEGTYPFLRNAIQIINPSVK